MSYVKTETSGLSVSLGYRSPSLACGAQHQAGLSFQNSARSPFCPPHKLGFLRGPQGLACSKCECRVFPPAKNESSCCSTSSPAFGVVSIPDCCHSNRCVVICHYIFIKQGCFRHGDTAVRPTASQPCGDPTGVEGDNRGKSTAQLASPEELAQTPVPSQ